MKPGFRPQRPRTPGTVKACVSDLVNQLGGIEFAMARAGVSQAVMYAYTAPDMKEEIPFTRVAAMTSPESPAGAVFLATLAGGVFLPLPRTANLVGELTADAVRESGEAAARLVQDLNDGVLTKHEAQRALPALNDALQAFARLTSTVTAIARGEEPQ